MLFENNTNLLMCGRRFTIVAATSASSVATHSSYSSSGINGSYSSRYHNLSKLAGACASIEKYVKFSECDKKK